MWARDNPTSKVIDNVLIVDDIGVTFRGFFGDAAEQPVTLAQHVVFTGAGHLPPAALSFASACKFASKTDDTTRAFFGDDFDRELSRWCGIQRFTCQPTAHL